jgi:hypothetical protein
MGRPSEYNEATASRICEMITEGATIREIQETSGMPAWDTMRRWLNQFPEFQAQYARAREESGFALEMQIIDESNKAKDKDSAAAARVRIDALKWIAGKRAPKVYGDKQTIDLTGTMTVKDVPEDELDARIARHLAGATEAGVAGSAGRTGVPAPTKRLRS